MAGVPAPKIPVPVVLELCCQAIRPLLASKATACFPPVITIIFLPSNAGGADIVPKALCRHLILPDDALIKITSPDPVVAAIIPLA